jgi:hypothetical protein
VEPAIGAAIVNVRIAAGVMAVSQAVAGGQSRAFAGARSRAVFQVMVHLPYARAAPLFGAWAEQQWAPDWKPQFVYPTPPADEPGAVFKVEHGSHSSIWMTSIFDLESGHIQYVNVLDDVLITRIDIVVRAKGVSETGVSVTYERTALNAAAEEHLKHFAEGDSRAGAEWQKQLDTYVAKVKTESNKPHSRP